MKVREMEIMKFLEEKAGIPYALVVYKRPRNKGGKKISAKAIGKRGEVLITQETFTEFEKEIRERALKCYDAKYEWLAWKMLSSLEEEEEDGWVRCWECGRYVRKSQAVWEDAGWYCGC